MSTISASTTTTNAYVVTADTTGQLVLQTGAGPTTAMTIDGSQVVTLANALSVASGGTGQTTYTNGQLLIGNTTGNTLAKATLTAGSGITITNGPGSITIASSGGGVTSLTGTTNQITVSASTGNVTLSTPQDLAAASSPTFTNLYLGGAGTSGSSQLVIAGYNAYGGSGYQGFLSVTNQWGGATNPNKFFRLTGAGAIEIVNSAYSAVIFTFDNAGNFTAAANVTAYSDERVKKNWRGLGNNFLEKLSGVKYGVFDRTDVELTQVGVSAQSLQEVMPEAVHTDEEDKLSVSYGNAALAACIELAKEVVSLRTRVATLQAEVAVLKGVQ